MPSFLFAFALVLLASAGSREQRLAAALGERLGPGGVLSAGVLASVISAAFMAWAGAAVAAMLGVSAKPMLVAFALLAAAAELAWPAKLRLPGEPTRSLGAIFIVLLARQLGDAPRFLVFALAAATGVPWLAGLGGALGGIAALGAGYAAGEQLLAHPGLRWVRFSLAAAMLFAALYIGFLARGIID